MALGKPYDVSSLSFVIWCMGVRAVMRVTKTNLYEVLGMCLALSKCVIRDWLLSLIPSESRLHSCHLYDNTIHEHSLLSPSKLPERSGSRQPQLRLTSLLK